MPLRSVLALMIFKKNRFASIFVQGAELGDMTPEIGATSHTGGKAAQDAACRSIKRWAAVKIISSRVSKGVLTYRCRYTTPGDKVTNKHRIVTMSPAGKTKVLLYRCWWQRAVGFTWL